MSKRWFDTIVNKSSDNGLCDKCNTCLYFENDYLSEPCCFCFGDSTSPFFKWVSSDTVIIKMTLKDKFFNFLNSIKSYIYLWFVDLFEYLLEYWAYFRKKYIK